MQIYSRIMLLKIEQCKMNYLFIDMGKFVVIWGPNVNAPTFSENISYEQKKNRLYLLMAATMTGLTNYVYEFWHFSYRDQYDTFRRQCMAQ